MEEVHFYAFPHTALTSTDITVTQREPQKYFWSTSLSHKRGLMCTDHSFLRQILPNSAAPFAKFCGSPRQILGIPRLTAAAHFKSHCADFDPVISS